MNRDELLMQVWQAQDEAYDLMNEYDSLPHRYGSFTLYQAEAYIVNWIGRVPDITTTELAEALKKTPSACSQIIRKLISKGLVEQRQDDSNKRRHNLRLTDSGRQLYRDHIAFNEYCQRQTFAMLTAFTDEQLQAHLAVQQRLNQAYQKDIRASRQHNGED